MKAITFTVPCYNSAAYMMRCIDSLLVCGERAEIIIVDDGSTDGTGQLADLYKQRFPDIVKVVHKENGGHGSGVNTGLWQASGLYFKVVDSDDWLDADALKQLIQEIDKWEQEKKLVDLFICNYIYDHLNEGKQKVMRYRNVFKKGTIQLWKDTRPFRPSQYLVMHAMIYRTDLLKAVGLKLPEHTFYVDNLFANEPLPHVRTMCYLDLNLYHYFLGREDQSVNEEILKKRIDQQIKVTKLIAFSTDLTLVDELTPNLGVYLRRNISVMMAISSIHLLLINDEEALGKREELWNYVKGRNYDLWRWLKYHSLSGWTMIPGRFGRFITLFGYRAAKLLYSFS